MNNVAHTLTSPGGSIVHVEIVDPPDTEVWRKLFNRVIEQFNKVIPQRFSEETIADQARIIVERLQHVQDANREANSATQSQFAQLWKIREAMERVLPASGINQTTLESRVTQLVENYQALQKEKHTVTEAWKNQCDTITKVINELNRADVPCGETSERVSTLARDCEHAEGALRAVLDVLDHNDEVMTGELGVTTRVEGVTIARRVEIVCENLRTAMKANAAFAKAATTVGVTSLTQAEWQHKIEVLQKENRKLRNQVDNLRVYDSSVQKSHALLDSLSEQRGGHVSARIQAFVDEIRKRLSAVENDRMRQEIMNRRTVQGGIDALVDAYNNCYRKLKTFF